MANTLLTPTIIAKEAIIALENNMVLGNLVHRAYSSEFQSVGATVNIRKPTTFTASVWASTIAVQAAAESTVQVALNTLFDVSFEVTSQELTHDIADFSEQFIQPAMRAHAQVVDSSLAALYADVSGNRPVSSTPAVSDITGIGAVLHVQKVPMADRRLVMHPISEASYMALDAFLHAEKRADGGKALRDASMGRVLGFDCYMDQNIKTHTATTTAATALVNGATFAAGGTTLVFDNHGVAAGTASAGDVIKIGDDEWCLAVGGTWAANAGTIITSKRLGAVDNNEVINFYGTHRANLAFHKNAFALVTAPLQPPLKSEAQAAVLNYKGISCRVVYDYTISTKKNTISIDQLCGFKTLDKDLAGRLMDAR